jgi:hypothetical protein
LVIAVNDQDRLLTSIDLPAEVTEVTEVTEVMEVIGWGWLGLEWEWEWEWKDLPAIQRPEGSRRWHCKRHEGMGNVRSSFCRSIFTMVGSNTEQKNRDTRKYRET